MKLRRFPFAFRRFLEQPRQVFFICVVFVGMSLFFNGTFWRLWNLHRDRERKVREMASTRQEIAALQQQLRQAKDPAFIERLAKDRMDFAGENDLVFVFPNP